MAGRVPKAGKPREALRRRNRPEEWVALPPECTLKPPAWPLDSRPPLRRIFGRGCGRCRLLRSGGSRRVEPSIVARYVRLALSKPEHASVGRLETELGLTPAALARLRLFVEAPEPEPERRTRSVRTSDEGEEMSELGLEVLRWAHRYLPSPSDPSKPLVLTDAQAEFVLDFYEGDEDGTFVYRRAALEGPKGIGKVAVWARFSRWRSSPGRRRRRSRGCRSPR